jgi:hypothetical protein
VRRALVDNEGGEAGDYEDREDSRCVRGTEVGDIPDALGFPHFVVFKHLNCCFALRPFVSGIPVSFSAGLAALLLHAAGVILIAGATFRLLVFGILDSRTHARKVKPQLSPACVIPDDQ